MAKRSFIRFLWMVVVNVMSLLCALFYQNIVGMTWFVFELIFAIVTMIWFWEHIDSWILHLKKKNLMKTHL